MEVNENFWGTAEALFEGYNSRTGALTLEDPDFENYPPFVYNKMVSDISGLTSYEQYALRGAFVKLGETNPFILDKPYPDYSVAYVGMQNPDLPQLNISCLGQNQEAESGDYSNLQEVYKSDPDAVKPIAFITDRYLRTLTGSTGYTALDGLWYNFYYSTTQGTYSNGKYVYSPHSRDGYPANSTRNVSVDLGYWRSVGLKSFFGVIYVRYVDAALNETTGLPTKSDYAEVTLHWYKSQTTEWKEAHPIAGAYMRTYRRSTIAGAYTTMNGSSAFSNCFAPDLSQGIKANPQYWSALPEDDANIITPACCIKDGNNNAFPIFGGFQQTTGTIILQVGTNASGGLTSTTMPCFVGYNMGELHQGIGTVANRRSCWLTTPGTGDLEWIMRGAAAYGVFFTDGDANDSGYSLLFSENYDPFRWVDDKMCLGTVEDGGVTRGNYTRGTKNPTNRNFDWKTTNDNDYDPAHPPGLPNEYSTSTVFNDISDVATLTRRYALTKTDVETLGHELWQISYDLINNIQNDEWNKYTAEILDTFLTNNPIDCIVSLEKYPMTIPKQAGPVTLKLGKAATSITCNITTATTQTYYFNPVPIQPCYGNSFLDYEPYTHFELYVPFCGTVDLNPRDILGRNLSVNLVVDFTTGTCVAYVLSDSLVIETINGKLSLSIPVTGIDSTTIASQITNGILNTRNARYQHEFTTLSKFATPRGLLSNVGDVFGSASAVLTSETEARAAEYELTHQQAAPHIIGSASPVGSWAIDFRCRLLIYYPTGDVIDNSKATFKFNSEPYQRYAETIGFACAEPGTPGTYRGLLQATSPRLENMATNNGTRIATADELQMIQEALASGIIV